MKTSIENITKVTQTISQKGIMTQAVQGYDELGNKIREVTREGEKLYDTIETKGSFQEALEEANRLYAEQHDVLQRLYKLRLQ